jgi:hypothetical protein
VAAAARSRRIKELEVELDRVKAELQDARDMRLDAAAVEGMEEEKIEMQEAVIRLEVRRADGSVLLDRGFTGWMEL